MNPDNFFRQMELRTERELYRRSFKAAAQSQDAMFEKFQNKIDPLRFCLSQEGALIDCDSQSVSIL